MKRFELALGLLAIIGSLWLAWEIVPSPRSKEPQVGLQDIVSGLVANDRLVKNCVVSVMRGDG
jgi:hypothetical protein